MRSGERLKVSSRRHFLMSNRSATFSITTLLGFYDSRRNRLFLCAPVSWANPDRSTHQLRGCSQPLTIVSRGFLRGWGHRLHGLWPDLLNLKPQTTLSRKQLFISPWLHPSTITQRKRCLCVLSASLAARVSGCWYF